MELRGDPDRRALHLGCGAALLNLRTVAVHSGLSPLVELLPDEADPDSLALVRFRPAAFDAAEQDLASLYGAIAKRHTSRRPFVDLPIPTLLRERLAAEAQREGATLTFPTGWHHSFILELVEEAELEAAYRGDPDEQNWLRLRDPESGPPEDGVTEAQPRPHTARRADSGPELRAASHAARTRNGGVRADTAAGDRQHALGWAAVLAGCWGSHGASAVASNAGGAGG